MSSLSTADLKELEAFALQLAEAAAEVALPLFRVADQGEVSKDGHSQGFDPVTEADRGAERAIRALIYAHYPTHGVIGEEYGEERPDAEFVWVLDPVDGTRAFISGLPLWTTLIALRHKGRPVLGIISQPVLKEIFLGSPLGSRLITPEGETPLKVRDGGTLENAVFATTDPDLYYGGEHDAFYALRSKVRLMRYGCDAYAFAMVAQGTMDAAVETGLKAWDIEAIIPVIENAGGVVTNWHGDAVGQAGGQVIAAGSQAILDAAVGYLKPAAE
ncbi:MAG: histidinol-phosphatase [Asticcacaulis sp.]